MNIHPLISFQLLLPERNTIETMQNDPPSPPPPHPPPTTIPPWSSALSCRSLTGLYKLCPMITYPVISFELLQPDRTVQTMPHDHLPCHQLWVVAAWQDCTNYAPWSPTLSSALSCRSFMSSWNLKKASMPMGWMLRTRHTAWSCLRDRLSRVISSSNSLANLRISLVVGRIPCLRIYNNVPYNLFVCVLFLHAADSHFCCTLNDECIYTHESKWPHQ